VIKEHHKLQDASLPTFYAAHHCGLIVTHLQNLYSYCGLLGCV
jgi:hypothetical protein